MTESKTPAPDGHLCALCGQRRAHGSLLKPTASDETDTMWVCDDCQHKLNRRVDDESVKGG